MNKSVILAILAAGTMLMGCDHKVNLTFVNTTPQTRDVEVNSPGEGTCFVGTIPSGGKKEATLKIPKDELPATVSWSAGDIGDRLTVDKDVKKRIIYIEPHGSTTIDKKTEVHKKDTKELAPQKVEQHEVIE